jgi:biotin synthase
LKLNRILTKALKEPPTREETLQLLRKVQGYDKLLKLVKTASRVRDDEVGQVFKFDGFIWPVTSCTTSPPCRYCGRSAGLWGLDNPLTLDEIEVAGRFMNKVGLKRIGLGGGTMGAGAGKYITEAIRRVKMVAPFDVWVNIGPSLNRADLAKLKELGVCAVGSSIETINREVFMEAKPGDSLEARIRLAEEIMRMDLGFFSIMMVGIGSSYEDYVEHVFWLRRFKNLTLLTVSGFNPIPGTPFENRPPANPLEVAKIMAAARLVLRAPDISFGGVMIDWRLLPFMIMAGANRTFHLGCHVHKVGSEYQQHPPKVIPVERNGNLEFVNMLPLTIDIVKKLEMEADV